MTKKPKADTFVRVPGKARQYKNESTGELVSRRQRDQAIRTGGLSLEKAAKANRAAGKHNPMVRYNTLLHSRMNLLNADLPAGHPEYTLKEVRESEDMKRIIKDLRLKRKTADSNKSRALQELGLRDKSWTFAVGDTPVTKHPKRMKQSRRETRTGRK